MRHVGGGDHPAGGNLDPELKRGLGSRAGTREGLRWGRGCERSEPQAGDGSAAGGSSAS